MMVQKKMICGKEISYFTKIPSALSIFFISTFFCMKGVKSRKEYLPEIEKQEHISDRGRKSLHDA